MHTATADDIRAVRAELARREAAVAAWHDAHPQAVYDDSHTWGSRHPELCHLIRRAGDLEGWLAVAESGPVRHTAQEVMA